MLIGLKFKNFSSSVVWNIALFLFSPSCSQYFLIPTTLKFTTHYANFISTNPLMSAKEPSCQ